MDLQKVPHQQQQIQLLLSQPRNLHPRLLLLCHQLVLVLVLVLGRVLLLVLQEQTLLLIWQPS
jgi:hypothetical protein